MSTIRLPKDCRCAIAIQTSWGDAIADASPFIELHQPTLPDIDPDIKIRDVDAYHGTRNRIYSDLQTDEYGCAPKFTLQGDARLTELDLWLYGYFQSVSEGASTPYAKTITPNSGDVDFGSSAGLFFTFLFRDPASSASWKIKDCGIQNLELSISPGERLKYKADFVGRGAVNHTSNPSGTWTPSADTFFHFHNFVRFIIDFGGGNQTPIMRRFSLNFTKTHIAPDYDGAGNFSRHVFKDHKAMFDIDFIKDGNLITSKTNAGLGTPVDIELGWGSGTPGTVSGDLDFSFTGKITKPTRVFGDTLDAKIVGEILGIDRTTTPLTAIIANEVDRGW